MSANESSAAKQRTRSPNYPGISLSEAIPRIAQIYESEHNHAADGETLAIAMGYKGSNGASDVVISALKKYGWLENAGQRQYKLSEGAIDVYLHQRGDPERVKAIRDAAFTPPLFKELHDEFGDILPSENNLRIKLIKKGFNPKSVGDVIQAYRETLELVSLESAGYNADVAGKKEDKQDSKPAGEPPMQAAAQAKPQTPSATGHVPPPADGFQFQISERSVNVLFNGLVTQEAIKKLIKYLEISVDDFPTKKDLEQLKSRVEVDEVLDEVEQELNEGVE
jgi:hypothetical protein